MPDKYGRDYPYEIGPHRESNRKVIASTADMGAADLDLDWRPETYWPDGVDEPAHAMTDDPELVMSYGAAPGFGAGSHIPDLEAQEVEIACVMMQSTLGDAISIRARPLDGGRIGYRIVDEHETPYECRPSSSSQPLSLRELGELLDQSEERGEGEWGPGIPWTPLRCNFEVGGTTESLWEFLDVRSDVYPQLAIWYGSRISTWLCFVGPDDEEEFEDDEELEEEEDEEFEDDDEEEE